MKKLTQEELDSGLQYFEVRFETDFCGEWDDYVAIAYSDMEVEDAICDDLTEWYHSNWYPDPEDYDCEDEEELQKMFENGEITEGSMTITECDEEDFFLVYNDNPEEKLLYDAREKKSNSL